MANHKSAIKRNRQNEKKYERNKAYRTIVKNAIKNVTTEIEAANKDGATLAMKQAEKAISRVASKGVLHKVAASRKISGLAKKVHQLVSAG
ncbi:MAG: 30S ribosomal protein S20 [Nitrospinae bacterium CG11_big_fil_rev_8_21_14_0_20_45_15]|nr:MAG: 30S ribosomal protein S20 [Nitrospinae bacterium CG11_big_fil_rev_8_21_14_0_20_45_15]